MDQQCNVNRTGILCGTCKQGFSLTLENLNWALCENRYISLLLFFMAAGIIVVAVSLLLHMNISTGTLNGLILYANLVNIRRPIFPSTKSGSKIIDCIFIMDKLGLWNSSMFLLWTRCTFLCMASTSFLILPVDIDHSCCKYATFVGKLLGSNPVAMLATIILLSYTKLLQVCIGILSYEIVP